MPDTIIPHVLFPQGLWVTEESKTLKGGMVVNQQSNIRIALACAPNIVAETPEEAVLFRCDEHGMFIDCGFCAPSENEKNWSASGEL